LFEVVKKLGNYGFEDDSSSTALRTRVVSYALEAYKVLLWIGGQLTPLSCPPFPPNTSNQNFEIVILFKVVESSGNQIFEDDNPLRALRTRVVNYALVIYRRQGNI
jgi:hypothetical protein